MSVKEQFLNQKEIAQLLYVSSLFTSGRTIDDRQRGEILSNILRGKILDDLSPLLKDFAFNLIADFLIDNRDILNSLISHNKATGERDVFLRRMARWIQLVDKLLLTESLPPFTCDTRNGGLFLRV